MDNVLAELLHLDVVDVCDDVGVVVERTGDLVY